MRLSVLRLANVRNYAEAEFRPATGTTLIVGPNGSGKSTLLEAIGLFATLSSPRAGALGVLVRQGSPEAGLRLETDAAILEIRLSGGRAHLKAGGSGAVARTFLGRFKAVLFTPEDLDLVRGEPELRRRALDELIVQMRPAYRGIRQDFERALRQRNAALRQGLAEEARLYEAPLAAAAAQVLEARRTLVERLGPEAVALYDELAGKGRLGLRYRDASEAGERSGEDLVDWFRRRFEEDLPVELERGSTRKGPHRDDLEIEIDEMAARSYASRGEQRSAALAFRLAELRLLGEAVLLLDDVLSELDAQRRRRLFEVVRGTQTVVTATDGDAVPEAAASGRWQVEAGILREV